MVTTRRRIVKSIQLRVDEDIFEQLKEIKGDMTWEDFVTESCLRYGPVMEKAQKWDEIEPYLPRLTAHLLIEYLKKAAASSVFPDEEEAEKVG